MKVVLMAMGSSSSRMLRIEGINRLGLDQLDALFLAVEG